MFMQNFQTIGDLQNKKMHRILLNERSDTTQLLGCFEQTSQDLQALLSEFVEQHIQQMPSQIISLKHKITNNELLNS